MKVEYPEEDIILDDYEDRDDDVINGEEFDCTGAWKSIIDTITM